MSLTAKRGLLLVVAFSWICASCASTTVLHTSEPEAKVSLISGPRGNSSTLNYEDHLWLFGHTDIRVEKNGCAPQIYRVYRTDDFSARGFFLGLFTYGVGFLWAGQYLPTYELDYHCVALTKPATP